MTEYSIHSSEPLSGHLSVPGDKSISHRAVMLGAIARGTTRVTGLLRGDDVQRTIAAFRACGVQIDETQGCVAIHGAGLGGLKAPHEEIYLGNSGTSMRLLTGIFAAQKFATVLTGDESLSRRPMRRVIRPLRAMGADIALTDDKTAPIHIRPIERLNPINWTVNVASAQVKSAILLACLFVNGKSRVVNPHITRDHTGIMLRAFGSDIVKSGDDYVLTGQRELDAQIIDVPGDFSSAAFFIVAAMIVPGSEILLRNVGLNLTRTGLLSALNLMGGSYSIENRRMMSLESVGDIRVRYSGALKGIEVPQNLVSLMVDEIPILAIAAAAAKGTTVLSGCEELRVKESDRLDSVARGLAALGIEVEERPDGLVIEGGTLRGGQVDSFGDHRIAMAFAVAGAIAEDEVKIINCDCVNTSFPGFPELAGKSGIGIEAHADR